MKTIKEVREEVIKNTTEKIKREFGISGELLSHLIEACIADTWDQCAQYILNHETVAGLENSIQAFIDKTQDVSKLTGENRMKAPEEYTAMLSALAEFYKLRGQL